MDSRRTVMKSSDDVLTLVVRVIIEVVPKFAELCVRLHEWRMDRKKKKKTKDEKKKKTKAGIVVVNESKKLVRVNVSGESSSCDGFSEVCPGDSDRFVVEEGVELAYVTIVYDPDGDRREICRNRKCNVGEEITITKGGRFGRK